MKAKVVALAKKQGAELSLGYTSSGDLYLEILLPEGFIWDNRSFNSVYCQEQDPGESMADFWKSAYSFINYPVVRS